MVTPEEFVRTYKLGIKEGYSLDVIASSLGMKKEAVISRASRYRRLGVKLPYYPQDRKNDDRRTVKPEELNKIIV